MLSVPSSGRQRAACKILAWRLGGVANAINNSGVVAGSFPGSSGATHAFLWTATGGMQDLGSLGSGTAEASAINSFGKVVGRSVTSSGSFPGFRWTLSGGMDALATLLPETYSDGVAVNSSGEIVGFALNTKIQQRAVMWDKSFKVHDLNQLTVNSPLILLFANGVNTSGQIVGIGRSKINPALSHAYLLTPTKTEGPWVGGAYQCECRLVYGT